MGSNIWRHRSKRAKARAAERKYETSVRQSLVFGVQQLKDVLAAALMAHLLFQLDAYSGSSVWPFVITINDSHYVVML